jgi:3-oxoacyl-(acyl-carrier-protein) synthase
MRKRNRVVITGIGILAPNGIGLEAFWESLLAGRSGIGPITLFLEIFHRWLVKAGELEVTEMLPDPDHLLWPESDGRRTFELRTMIVPRS